MEQVGVKTARLDSQGGKASRHGKGFRLSSGGFGSRVECGINDAKRRSGACRNLFLGDAPSCKQRRTLSQPGAIGYFAPAGSALELEGDQFRDLLENLSQGPRTIDVFEDATAAVFKGGQSGGLSAHIALQSPASDAYDDYDRQQ